MKYFLNRAPMARHSTRRLRKIAGENQEKESRKGQPIRARITGCLNAIQSPKGMKMSPAMLSPMFVNGSGSDWQQPCCSLRRMPGEGNASAEKRDHGASYGVFRPQGGSAEEKRSSRPDKV